MAAVFDSGSIRARSRTRNAAVSSTELTLPLGVGTIDDALDAALLDLIGALARQVAREDHVRNTTIY
jgi:hypothetical protein